MRNIISRLIHSCPIFQYVWNWIKVLHIFNYDCKRFCKYSGVFDLDNENALRAKLSMEYHGIEKGLTMPNRHFPFGVMAVIELMKTIEQYAKRYGNDDGQFVHAVAVLRDYYEQLQKYKNDTYADLRSRIASCLEQYPEIGVVKQEHTTKDKYFSAIELPFPLFAKSRHAIRHYIGEVALDTIEQAVKIAESSPSACNRQHTRVHCIVNKEIIKKTLALQPGNRGFGDGADKLLVITADLACVRWAEERNDIYFNAGLYVMNLSYALHYLKVAHCYLSCSIPPRDEARIRKMLTISDSEEIVLMITCGKAPNEFDVALSPKRSYKEIFTVHR